MVYSAVRCPCCNDTALASKAASAWIVARQQRCASKLWPVMLVVRVCGIASDIKGRGGEGSDPVSGTRRETEQTDERGRKGGERSPSGMSCFCRDGEGDGGENHSHGPRTGIVWSDGVLVDRCSTYRGVGRDEGADDRDGVVKRREARRRKGMMRMMR